MDIKKGIGLGFLDGIIGMGAMAAGMLSYMHSTFNNRDELKVKVDRAIKNIEATARQIDHWNMLIRGYARVMQKAEADERVRLEAKVNMMMLQSVVEEAEQNIMQYEAFLDANREEAEKRQKSRDNTLGEYRREALDAQNLADERQREIFELQAQVKTAVEGKDKIAAEYDKLAAQHRDLELTLRIVEHALRPIGSF